MPTARHPRAAAPPKSFVARLAAATTLHIPTIAAVVLAVVATGLQVANEQVLTSNPQWQGVIAVFLVFLVGIGVSPLTGGAGLRNLVHLPAWLAVILTAFVSAATGALQVVHMTATAHTVVAAVLTFLAACGFATSAPIVAAETNRK